VAMRNSRALLVIATLLITMVVSCTRTGRPLNERLQAALDKRLRQCDVKGASAAVVFPGRRRERRKEEGAGARH
jgi:hypothetical protein